MHEMKRWDERWRVKSDLFLTGSRISLSLSILAVLCVMSECNGFWCKVRLSECKTNKNHLLYEWALPDTLSFFQTPTTTIYRRLVCQTEYSMQRIDIFRKQKTTLNTSRSALLKFFWQECGAVILLHSSAADHPSAALHKHQDQSLPGVKSEYFLHIFLLLLETIVNALHCYSSINPL